MEWPLPQQFSCCLLQLYKLSISFNNLWFKIHWETYFSSLADYNPLAPGLQTHSNESPRFYSLENRRILPHYEHYFYKIFKTELTVITALTWKIQLLHIATTCLEYPLYINTISSFRCSVMLQCLMIKTLHTYYKCQYGFIRQPSCFCFHNTDFTLSANLLPVGLFLLSAIFLSFCLNNLQVCQVFCPFE